MGMDWQRRKRKIRQTEKVEEMMMSWERTKKYKKCRIKWIQKVYIGKGYKKK